MKLLQFLSKFCTVDIKTASSFYFVGQYPIKEVDFWVYTAGKWSSFMCRFVI